MLLQMIVTFKQLPAKMTVIRSTVAVYTTFVSSAVAGIAEMFVTHRTIEWFVSCVPVWTLM